MIDAVMASCLSGLGADGGTSTCRNLPPVAILPLASFT